MSQIKLTNSQASKMIAAILRSNLSSRKKRKLAAFFAGSTITLAQLAEVQDSLLPEEIRAADEALASDLRDIFTNRDFDMTQAEWDALK